MRPHLSCDRQLHTAGVDQVFAKPLQETEINAWKALSLGFMARGADPGHRQGEDHAGAVAMPYLKAHLGVDDALPILWSNSPVKASMAMTCMEDAVSAKPMEFAFLAGFGIDHFVVALIDALALPIGAGSAASSLTITPASGVEGERHSAGRFDASSARTPDADDPGAASVQRDHRRLNGHIFTQFTGIRPAITFNAAAPVSGRIDAASMEMISCYKPTMSHAC